MAFIDILNIVTYTVFVTMCFSYIYEGKIMAKTDTKSKKPMSLKRWSTSYWCQTRESSAPNPSLSIWSVKE